jgi:hypothetical protein
VRRTGKDFTLRLHFSDFAMNNDDICKANGENATTESMTLLSNTSSNEEMKRFDRDYPSQRYSSEDGENFVTGKQRNDIKGLLESPSIISV